MDKKQIRPVRANQATMWTLSADRKLVRLAVPPLPIVGFPQPLNVYMDFDAKTVDAMLERLTILRNQMLPPLPAPRQKELSNQYQCISRHWFPIKELSAGCDRVPSRGGADGCQCADPRPEPDRSR
jgi:hypothetical protein